LGDELVDRVQSGFAAFIHAYQVAPGDDQRRHTRYAKGRQAAFVLAHALCHGRPPRCGEERVGCGADAVNEFRKGGMTTWEAVVAGTTRRFRPIVLTSLTTFFGLAPMMLESSPQARFLVPMAVSLGFGVLFTTVIALIIVPCLYLVLEDVTRLVKGKAIVTAPEPAE